MQIIPIQAEPNQAITVTLAGNPAWVFKSVCAIKTEMPAPARAGIS
jgi:hypothetical protein